MSHFLLVDMNTYLELMYLCGITDTKVGATQIIRQMIESMLYEWKKDVVEIEEDLKAKLLAHAKIGQPEEEGKLRKVLQFEDGESDDDDEDFKKEVDSEEDVDDEPGDMFA